MSVFDCTHEMHHSWETAVSAQTPLIARGACSYSAEGLASLVKGEVPQGRERPACGRAT